jgi:hypothetical protein
MKGTSITKYPDYNTINNVDLWITAIPLWISPCITYGKSNTYFPQVTHRLTHNFIFSAVIHKLHII